MKDTTRKNTGKQTSTGKTEKERHMAKKSYAERKFKFETLQLHVGQETPDPATDARAVPI